jgi:hypothetical protein
MQEQVCYPCAKLLVCLEDCVGICRKNNYQHTTILRDACDKFQI